MSESIYELDMPSSASSLVTIKIVASEKISTRSVNYTKKAPNCSAWVYKTLVNSYPTTEGDVVKMVGTPTYDLIGQTDDAKKWYVDVAVKENRLNITVNGAVTDKNTSLQWEIDIETLKV
jgi:hypothetical protein